MMGHLDERRLILEMIDDGKITAEEGLRLLQALPADQVEDYEATGSPETDSEPDNSAAQTAGAAIAGMTPAAEPAPSPQDAEPMDSAEQPAAGEQEPTAPVFKRWHGFWTYPFWAGVTITVLGSLFMFWAQQATGMSFWFFCAGIPFTLGIVIMVIAWQSRSARWLHLRVQQSAGDWPKNFAVSFPLPLRVSGWFMRTFRHRIPGMDDASVDIDAVMAALEQSVSPEKPLYLEVEEDGGERVQIYIG
jgi:hypothetical protein